MLGSDGIEERSLLLVGCTSEQQQQQQQQQQQLGSGYYSTSESWPAAAPPWLNFSSTALPLAPAPQLLTFVPALSAALCIITHP